MTHTSGYKGYYLESPMVSSFFNGRNDFYGVTKEMVSDKAGNLNMNKAVMILYILIMVMQY